MQTYGKTSFLLYTVTLLMCLNSLFLGHTDAQVAPAGPNYTFESIEVPGREAENADRGAVARFFYGEEDR